MWYYKVVGKEKCSIVDTFWQTETGGHVITPLPGATPMKPGSAVSLLFFFKNNQKIIYNSFLSHFPSLVFNPFYLMKVERKLMERVKVILFLQDHGLE